MARTYKIVVAYSFPHGGIGKNGGIPWHITGDLQRFKELTTSKTMGSSAETRGEINAVIMGRKTWDSLPYKPLRGRLNIVITRDPILLGAENTSAFIRYCRFEDLDATLASYYTARVCGNFIIGVGEIYLLAIDHLLITHIYATEVYMTPEPEYDSVFPLFLDSQQFVISAVSPFQKGIDLHYRYMTFVNVNAYSTEHVQWESEECAYLGLMRTILSSEVRSERTGVGTYSVFGKQLEYDLSDTFPLTTTKRMFMRGIFEELMLYLRGQTDNKILTAAGVRVWTANTTREFLDARGLQHYEVGDMGATYGFNFRHYGAEYRGCSASYAGQGYDQLAEVIRLLRHDPTSRRIIINLWNPAANQNAALPACLCMYQFYVRSGKYLDLQIYIRSSDFFLANNWNTCTGALLVKLLCAMKDIPYTPGRLSVIMGDAHIYTFHESQARLNLGRVPYPYPKLEIIGDAKENIEDFTFADLQLIGYRAHPRIDAPMAV
jgi:dihydrofolate reductase/thymidylate synthase